MFGCHLFEIWQSYLAIILAFVKTFLNSKGHHLDTNKTHFCLDQNCIDLQSVTTVQMYIYIYI